MKAILPGLHAVKAGKKLSRHLPVAYRRGNSMIDIAPVASGSECAAGKSYEQHFHYLAAAELLPEQVRQWGGTPGQTAGLSTMQAAFGIEASPGVRFHHQDKNRHFIGLQPQLMDPLHDASHAFKDAASPWRAVSEAGGLQGPGRLQQARALEIARHCLADVALC
eukprot:365387-Chlamydomonas_euryale.AAC.8